MTKQVDFNCDMGESLGVYRFGNDEVAARHITTANVACGFHAGDPNTIKRTVELLKRNGVAIGAHPGLPDVWGFGRRSMAINAEDARNYVIYQVGALKAFVEAAGMKLHHVKPHGALFTLSKFDDTLSRAVLEGIRDVDPRVLVYCPGPLSLFKYEKHAREMGLKIIAEFYADLDYTPAGTLQVSKLQGEDRSFDVDRCVQRVKKFLREGKVTKTNGEELAFEAQSISLHGDSPEAGRLIQTLRAELEKDGVKFAAC